MKIEKTGDLITIFVDGKSIELWGLVQNARDKRERWELDVDYIESLISAAKSKDNDKSNEAIRALIFLDAFFLATLDRNFERLESQGVKPNSEFKTNVYNSSNSAQRDFCNNNQGAQTDLPPELYIEQGNSIVQKVEDVKAVKSNLRKQKVSISSLRSSKVEIKTSDSEPQPVKHFTPKEIAQLNKRHKNKS